MRPTRPTRRGPARLGAIAVAVLWAGCHDPQGTLADGGADAPAVPADGADTVDAGAIDAGPPDAAGGAGSCVVTLSNAVNANAANATIAFPYMFVVNKGQTCNSATPPTLCSVAATDPGIPTVWGFYEQPDSFADGTTMPIIAAIATQPGTAIGSYTENLKRWDAQSGTVTIDHLDGHLLSLHATAQMAPDTVNAGGATGTFQLGVICTQIDFRP